MKNVQRVLCLVFLVLALVQCSSLDKSGEPTATSSAALTGPTTFTIPLPPQVSLQSIAAGANDTLLIDDRTVVRTPAGSFATIANLGSNPTNLGTDTRVGNVWSVGRVVLRDRARVAGFVRSQSTVVVPATASVVPGPVVQNTPFTPLDSISWTVTFPSSTGDVLLQPRARRTLPPGSYGALTVQATATLTLTAGTYFFQSLDFESQAVVSLDDRNGPISIYVASSVIYRGAVSDTANKPTSILFGYAGTAAVAIEAPFIGTFVAPGARVTVGSFTHRGAFFGKGLEFLPGATLIAQAFPAVPVIDIKPGGTVLTQEPVYFQARATAPGFAFPLTFVWSVTSTPPGLRFSLDHGIDTATFYGIDPGLFTVTLTTTDALGRRTIMNTPIRVLQAQVPPARPDRLDENADIIQRPCRDGDETIAQFATRCDKAMGGVTVPDFDCDAMTAKEPPGQGDGTVACDAPNVLNSMCDPGSHFQVLHRNNGGDGVYVVAHCRHIALRDKNGPGQYSDVAVIQYNANTGATCYYQALQPGLSHNAPAPSSGSSYWKSPAYTAATVNCVRCHDNGPLIRSPYLAQLGQVWPFYQDLTNPNNPGAPSSLPTENANYLPGTLAADIRGVWNKSLPYEFVGLNFQSWEAYTLTNTADPTCTSCHRMGISRSVGAWNADGSSQDLGIRATNPTQESKVDHGRLDPGKASPIWMVPGQFTSNTASSNSADSMKQCAVSVKGVPIDGCSATRYARGDTCPPPPVVINGATRATDPTTWKTGGKTPLGQPGGRVGFYYFTTVHGPFYQNSAWDPYMNVPPAVANPPWDPPANAPTFRGTYLRIYIEPAGQWMLAWGLDATDIQNPNNNPPPPGSPGGVIEGVAFDQIDSAPLPANCGSGYHVVADPTGASATTTTTVDATAGTSAVILAGLIGNVSRGQVFDGEGLFSSSYISTGDESGTTVWAQGHDPEIPGNQWFTGESWSNGCTGWVASAHYAAERMWSFDDIPLVAIADVPHTICYIDGIGGDWSKSQPDGQGGSVQPYAQIYIDPETGYRLKVFPSGNGDPARISASATCLYLKN